MDMMIKAIALAGEGIGYARSFEIERIASYCTVFDQVLSIADRLGCEEQDIVEARRHLEELTERRISRHKVLLDKVADEIERQEINGGDVRGLTLPVNSTETRDMLSRGIEGIADAGRAGALITLKVGAHEPMEIRAHEIVLVDDGLHISGKNWTVGGIDAVSLEGGLGLLCGNTLIRVDCSTERRGMSPEDVRQLQPGDLVTLLEETMGQDSDDQERTYPAGTVGEVSQIRTLPAPQGLSVTVIIGPQDGPETIVNVFDEGDAWFPLATRKPEVATSHD